jgi:uracil-DNA glycosylase
VAGDVEIAPDWKALLEAEFSKDYFKQLTEFVRSEYKTGDIYPPGKHIFRALNETPVSDVKVVILGQDPYHGPGQANGLCFSVNPGIKVPPSLVNIFKEIKEDLGAPVPNYGDLSSWARQGVLLLNATLTVRKGQAGSHQNKGWEHFTDAVIKAVNAERKSVVYMLWGSYARKKGQVINREYNLVLESPHPSPLSAHRGFFGNGHFSKANAYLESKDVEPVEWGLSDL